MLHRIINLSNKKIFSSTRVSYRYHLAHRSYTGELEMRNTVYVSLPESHMVIMLKSVDHPEPVER